MPSGLTLHDAADSLEYVEQLLARAGLPTADVRDKPECFYLAVRGDERVGVGGVEHHGAAGLLRSVVIEPAYRGRGHGEALIDALEGEASDLGIESLYLLTETADGFFERLGYEIVERDDAPPSIQGTDEFAELCGDAAVCLRKAL